MPNHVHGIVIIDKPMNDRNNAVDCNNVVDCIRMYIKQNPANWSNDRQNLNVQNKCGEPGFHYQQEFWMV